VVVILWPCEVDGDRSGAVRDRPVGAGGCRHGRALGRAGGRFERTAYVAEATGGRWLHVRIDYRGYSIPLGVAEGVLIGVPEASEPPSATDAYSVLVSRLDRRSWRSG
jgi:hypothetical protein